MSTYPETDTWQTQPDDEEVMEHTEGLTDMWYLAFGASNAWMMTLGALIFSWYPYMIATNNWWKT